MRILTPCLVCLLALPALGGPRLKLRDLTPQQCARLAPLAREVEHLRAREAAAEARLLPRFLEACRTLRDEVQRDEPPTPETMRAAGGLNRKLKELHAQTGARVRRIEARAAAILGVEPPAPPREEVERLRAEIAHIQRERSGGVGPVGRWLATPGLADALEARAKGRPLPPRPRKQARPDAALRREIGALRKEINLWNLINGMHFTRPQLATLARGAPDADAVLARLTAEQRNVLLHYKSCLIPPRDLRDPVRAGQADDADSRRKQIARLRRVPEERLEAALLQTLARIEEREGSYTPGERFACYLLLRDTVTRARRLDDVRFEVRAEALAQELEPLFRLHERKRRLAEALGEETVLRAKAQRFLLDDRIAPLCRQRLQAGPVRAPREGPLPQAERCPEGSCGRP